MKTNKNLFNRLLRNNKSAFIDAYELLANHCPIWNGPMTPSRANLLNEIISSKYFDNKDFALEHIHKNNFYIRDISKRLRNDREVVLKFLKSQNRLPYYLPEICSKDKFLINFIIENKKYDSFKFVERLDHSFQTKKNIIRSFGHSKDILVPNHKNYVDKHGGYKIPSSHPKYVSLFTKFHVSSEPEFNYPSWYKSQRSNLYDDLEIKKQALKLSPSAAFLFMLNNEITLEEYANIIVDYVLSPKEYFGDLPFPFDDYWDCISTTKLQSRLNSSGVDFILLQNSILDAFFKKTKSIDKLLNFRAHWSCFNTISASKKISENIDINKISDLQISKFLFRFRFITKDFSNDSEHIGISFDDPSHPLSFMYKKIRSKKFLLSKFIKNSPKSAADQIWEIAYQSGLEPGWIGKNEYAKCFNSHEIRKFYDNLDEKVKSSKHFLIKFKQLLYLSNYPECGFPRTFFDDIAKRTIEHIESHKDIEFLKKIILYESTWTHRYNAGAQSYSKLFYFRISDKMKTREIMKYFLLKNPNFLMDEPPHKYSRRDPRKVPFCKRKHLSKIVNDRFYFKLVEKKGLTCFKENLIPTNLLDNKKFMIKAIIKSYKTFKYASKRIKSDPNVVKFTHLINTKSFKFASVSCKKNKSLLDDLFHDKPEEKFLRAHITIKTDKDICVPAFESNMLLAENLSLKRLQKIKPKWFKSELDRKKLFEIFCNKLGEDDLLLIAKYKRDFGLNKQETSDAYA